MITRNFNLNLYAGHSSPLVINANQYDHGEQWLFTLFNSDGTQYVPSTGAIVGIKSDGLGIINTGSVDVQGRVVINETQQMTAAVGKAVFELLIDDQTHGTANFIVLVEPKPGDQADLSESDLSLIQQAIDGTSATAIAQGVSDWMDENLTPTTPVVDTSLTVQGAAADSAKVGQELSDLKSEISSLEAIPRSVKMAMDTLFQNLAFKNDNESYTDELTTFHAWATAVNLVSISAVFDQGQNNVYSIDDLDSLKQYLTVTATYDDSTTSVLADSSYTLSGTLTAGTSTITVSCEDKTTSFNVTVTGVTTLYTVENHTFNGTARTGIDTGIKLHDTDKDYTILIDFTAQAQSGTYRLLTDYTTVGDHTSGLSVVKNTSSVSKMRWCDGYQDFSDFNASTTGKIRFAFQHLAESDEMTLTLKKGTNAINSYTITSDFYACDTTMRIGTNTTSENTLKGTGSIYIYGAYLDSDHITAFLNGE